MNVQTVIFDQRYLSVIELMKSQLLMPLINLTLNNIDVSGATFMGNKNPFYERAI